MLHFIVVSFIRPMSVLPKRKRPLGKPALEARPKLFGGSIEEYVQVRGEHGLCVFVSKIKQRFHAFSFSLS